MAGVELSRETEGNYPQKGKSTPHPMSHPSLNTRSCELLAMTMLMLHQLEGGGKDGRINWDLTLQLQDNFKV